MYLKPFNVHHNKYGEKLLLKEKSIILELSSHKLTQLLSKINLTNSLIRVGRKFVSVECQLIVMHPVYRPSSYT